MKTDTKKKAVAKSAKRTGRNPAVPTEKRVAQSGMLCLARYYLIVPKDAKEAAEFGVDFNKCLYHDRGLAKAFVEAARLGIDAFEKTYEENCCGGAKPAPAKKPTAEKKPAAKGKARK